MRLRSLRKQACQQWQAEQAALVAQAKQERTDRQSMLIASSGDARTVLDRLKPKQTAKPKSRPFATGLFVPRKRRTTKQAKVYWQKRGDYWFSNLSLSDGNLYNLPSYGLDHAGKAGWVATQEQVDRLSVDCPELFHNR